MPRHPSVPGNQTGWIRLGSATTDTGLLAIIAPEVAGSFGDEWTSRYMGEDGEEPYEPAEELHEDGEDLHEPAEPTEPAEPSETAEPAELLDFQELQSDGDSAVLFATHADRGYVVEGRFGDYLGRTSLIEVRVRLWGCCCCCHDGYPGDEVKCEGDCHDVDPW